MKKEQFNLNLYLKKTSRPEYIYPNGAIFKQDCVSFLKAIKDSSVDLIFADPPYNIKKAGWDNIGSDRKSVV